MMDSILDIQSSPDGRNLAVNRVGIRRLRYPMIFEELENGQILHQPTIGYFDMLVDLPKDVKGTHMSRFIEMLQEQEVFLSVATIPTWLQRMVTRLQANHATLHVQFPFFLKKAAPISKVISMMDYDISLNGHLENGVIKTLVTVVIPVTSLCPCSKEIADYGAHNQRSHVTLTLQALPSFSLSDVIRLVESKASCELYGVLKRADEKAVTERAYDNPKFVEDMVRDVAKALDALGTIQGYKISSENFESIHNHSAYAEIERWTTPSPAPHQHSHAAAEVI